VHFCDAFSVPSVMFRDRSQRFASAAPVIA
jgi:hypothetical protein